MVLYWRDLGLKSSGFWKWLNARWSLLINTEVVTRSQVQVGSRFGRDVFVSFLPLFDLNGEHTPSRMVEIQSRMMCCHQAERNSRSFQRVAYKSQWHGARCSRFVQERLHVLPERSSYLVFRRMKKTLRPLKPSHQTCDMKGLDDCSLKCTKKVQLADCLQYFT